MEPIGKIVVDSASGDIKDFVGASAEFTGLNPDYEVMVLTGYTGDGSEANIADLPSGVLV